MIACDFCRKLAEKHDDTIFIAAPGGMVHICDECVADCVTTVAANRREGAE